jgi:hypothetical protein
MRNRHGLGLAALVVFTMALLAGCSSRTTWLTAGESPPTATPQVQPTSAATPAAQASQPAGPADPGTVLAALRGRMSAPDASYRLHVDARVSVGMVFSYDIEMAASGEDLEMTADMSSGSLHSVVSVVAVNGRGYAQVGSGTDWTEVDVSAVASMADQWLSLTNPNYFVFDGVEGTGATTLYRFRNSQPIPQHPESNSIITWGEVNITQCLLRVLADGTPVTIEATETGSATMSGSPVTVNGTMTYTFSDFGEPIVIDAPL